MATVTVNIENGKVFRIDDIPTDLVIVIRNYDISDTPNEKLSKDEHGKACETLEHHSAE